MTSQAALEMEWANLYIKWFETLKATFPNLLWINNLLDSLARTSTTTILPCLQCLPGMCSRKLLQAMRMRVYAYVGVGRLHL